MESAAAFAVLEFNLGPRFFQEALLDSDIEAGRHHFAYAVKATQKKMEKAQFKALESSRASHNRRKMEAMADAQKDREQRGVAHAPGAF